MNPQTTTDESVQKCQDIEYAQSRVVDWIAAEGMLYWDMDKLGVVKRPSVTSLAVELGVSRQTIYNWSRSIPDLPAKVKKARYGIDQQNVSAVWNATFLKACAGDVKAAIIYLSTFDSDFSLPSRRSSKPDNSSSLSELINIVRKRQSHTNVIQGATGSVSDQIS
jgi:hypothetical protein